MLPLSEADPEIKDKVIAITGACSCSTTHVAKAIFDITNDRIPTWDPHCTYHQMGEHFANLFRENRRLRQQLARIHQHKTGLR